MTTETLDRRKAGGIPKLRQWHAHATKLKQGVIERRREIGEAYLKAHADKDPGHIIDRSVGCAMVDMSQHPLGIATVKETRDLVTSRPHHMVRTKGSLDYLTDGCDYDQDSPSVKLAFSPEILCPIIRYHGMMPILFNIFDTRAGAKEVLTKTSHMYHADPNDAEQMKAFVHISDVDDQCGPFHALPANLTDRVIDELKYSHGRIMDEDVDRIAGANTALPSLGPAGTVCLCDTTRCIHFGGRPPAPGKPTREILVLRYHLPTNALYPAFEGDGDVPRPLTNLKPEPGDDAWNAFIGATLIY